MVGADSHAKAWACDSGVWPGATVRLNDVLAPLQLPGSFPFGYRGKWKKEKSLDGKQGKNMYVYTSV